MERAQRAPCRRGRGPQHALSAEKRFGRYQSESEQSVGAGEALLSPIQQKLSDAWRSLDVGEPYHRLMLARNTPNDELKTPGIAGVIRRLCTRYSTRDIEDFSVRLSQFQDDARFPEKAGIILSALINMGPDEEYTVRTAGLGKDPMFLGYKNTKRIIVIGHGGNDLGLGCIGGAITVLGDAGHRVGEYMEGGIIEVHGNADYLVGRGMFGGQIIIRGDCDAAGFHMSGGAIRVLGHAGEKVGELSKGGKIFLHGTYRSYCPSGAASIYNRAGRRLKRNIYDGNGRFVGMG